MKYFFYIVLLSGLTACNGRHSGAQAPGSGSQPELVSDSLHHYDTLDISGKQIVFSPLEQPAFEKLANQGLEADGPNDDAPLLIRDAAFIAKKDSVLTIKCANGIKVKLTEHTTCDGDNYIDYTYGGKLGQTPFLVFKVGYYEKLDYLLVNLNSGKQNKVWGTPDLSPDATTLVCSSFDLDVGFLPNGIQVFSTSADSLHLLWEQEFEKWGPEEVKWFDNQTIFIRQSTPVTGKGEILSYAKVKLN